MLQLWTWSLTEVKVGVSRCISLCPTAASVQNIDKYRYELLNKAYDEIEKTIKTKQETENGSQIDIGVLSDFLKQEAKNKE